MGQSAGFGSVNMYSAFKRLLDVVVSAVVLTLRHRPAVKRQNISDQVARTKDTAMEVRQVKSGQGL